MPSREDDIRLLQRIAEAAFATTAGARRTGRHTRRRTGKYFSGKLARGRMTRGKGVPAPDAFAVQDLLGSPGLVAAALEQATVTFKPFGDALASAGDVGKLSFSLELAVKQGDQSVREQFGMMNAYPELFPPCVCVENAGYEFLYMKLLADHRSLHDELFLEPEKYLVERRLADAVSGLWERLTPYYVRAEHPVDRCSVPWVLDRITHRVAQGLENLSLAGWLCEGVSANQLTAIPLELNGVQLAPLDELVKRASEIRDCDPVTVKFVHGDLHLSNILITRDAGFTLIDPDTDWCPGDYVWDFARFLQWLNVKGFIAVEERGGESELTPQTCESHGSLSMKISAPRQAIRSRLEEITREAMLVSAANLSDETAMRRLDLNLASAHLGLMKHLKEPDHLLLSLFHGCHHLARFIEGA